MNLHIRPAVADDGPVISNIFERAVLAQAEPFYSPEQTAHWSQAMTPDHFLNRFNSSFMTVAELDGKIVGFTGLEAETGYVTLCYTDPDFMGQGIGKAQLEALEDRARSLGLTRIHLSSSLNAQGFYLSQGFQSLGEEERESGSIRFRVVLMEKQIQK